LQKLIHILLIEDDPDDVELLETAFRDNQVVFESTVIPQGDHVLPHLEMCKIFPDIIILDLNLPKMNGKEVLSQIKHSESLKKIPVVILTTSSARADLDFCMQKGANDYLIKPVTLDDFNMIVQKILSVIKN